MQNIVRKYYLKTVSIFFIDVSPLFSIEPSLISNNLFLSSLVRPHLGITEVHT